ncbi:MAG TPA: TetR/AcrR family transcriptional regulator [Firmicutes bacterium]|jgi:AcrR family transcriptional regulator|nr:TetR/AcrR family transcriptional regulator [Bacillota bacterium]
MVQDRELTKNKIIIAAISCIERDGIQGLTTRNVAKEAGVNNASINYYFGTKENLIDQMFSHIKDHLFSDLEELFANKDLNVYSQLKVFFTFILRGISNYPNLIKALFYSYTDTTTFNKETTRVFDSYFNKLIERVEKEESIESAKNFRISLMQMFSAVIGLSLPGTIFKEYFNVNFDDLEAQQAYIDHLLKHYITWIGPAEIEKQTPAVNQMLDRLFNSDQVQ